MSDIFYERRQFLKQSALFSATAGAGLISPATFALDNRIVPTMPNRYPFFGLHQQGITTPAQHHIYFIVLDLHTDSLGKIREMFQMWTTYSTNLTSGRNVSRYGNNHYLPPIDTGEADSLNPYNLTLTFGVTASFLDKLKIGHLKPDELADLPHFPRDQLRADYLGGDLCIQACADDPQIAFHAVRNLVRIARSQVSPRWSQSGFNSFEGDATPRNLFGFKDGTGNPQGEAVEKAVWYQGNNWLKDGSFLVARRIQMHLETWDRTNLHSQEETFGRHRDSGAPLGKQGEFQAVDLAEKNAKGESIIPEISHLHLAKKTGLQILRRSFSYASGIDPKTGQFDAGLLFISFQKDPQQFIKIQNSLGNRDKMNEYITHIGSGLFACFAGVRDEKDYLGSALFERV